MAQQECDYYLASMKKAETQLSEAQDTRSVPQYAHYTFDFAEQVHIPHHARQVGPIYFKVCRKIQVLGICCDSNRKQVNYLIDEDNSIGVNGINTHGPNSVISMLDHYFTKHALQESNCHLHCDNCVGQNKSNYVTGYLAWRIIKGKHQEITLSFMRVGHTRCLVDGHFGLIKKIYRQSDTDTLSQMAELFNDLVPTMLHNYMIGSGAIGILFFQSFSNESHKSPNTSISDFLLQHQVLFMSVSAGILKRRPSVC